MVNSAESTTCIFLELTVDNASHKNCSKGYTLIETLIAMAIFSFMVLLGSTALDQSLQRYQGLLGKELGLWQFTKNIWLGKSLGSMIDYYVPIGNGQWAPYFMGDQSNLSYISLAPLAGDLPVVVWIKQEKNAENKRQLVYYEIPVYTKRASDLERDEVFGDYKRGNTIPIVEEADTIGLAFFVYNNQRGQHQWVEEFDGRTQHVLPAQIKISVTKDGRREDKLFTVNTNGLLKTGYGKTLVYPE